MRGLSFHWELMLFSSLLWLVFLDLSITCVNADEHPGSTTTTTLREYLQPLGEGEDDGDEGLYLAMAPAFFGFYGYFGALAGMEDELSSTNTTTTSTTPEFFSSGTSFLVEQDIFRGVAGASAGAMAAVLLAAGISPHRASVFVSGLGLADFADLGGLGGFLEGDRFEDIMSGFLQTASPIVAGNPTGSSSTAAFAAVPTRKPHYHWPLDLQDALIPVAVSTTDVSIQPTTITGLVSSLQSWVFPLGYIASTYLPSPKILKQGPMARAARASACFPGLFEPVGWIEHGFQNNYSLLIDGGIFDWYGYNGLKEILSGDEDRNSANENDGDSGGTNPRQTKSKTRVLNMVVGGFGTSPPGPKTVGKSLDAFVESVFSLSIRGLPGCGPLAMENGAFAVQAARRAVRDAMDRPVVATVLVGSSNGADDHQHQRQQYHYVLEIDALPFVDELFDKNSAERESK